MARSSKQKRAALEIESGHAHQDKNWLVRHCTGKDVQSKATVKTDGKSACKGMRQKQYQSGTTIAGYNQSVWIRRDVAKQSRN